MNEIRMNFLKKGQKQIISVKERKEVNRICKGIQVYGQRIVNIKSLKKLLKEMKSVE